MMTHLCMDIRGALRNAVDSGELDGCVTDPKTGKALKRQQIKDWLLDELSKGRRVVPLNSSCDNFDYQKGCKGHPDDWTTPTNKVKQMLFLIYGTEDGTRIAQFDDIQQLKQVMEDRSITSFRSALQEGSDRLLDSSTESWPEGAAVLIRGQVVVPQPKSVVQDWELPTS